MVAPEGEDDSRSRCGGHVLTCAVNGGSSVREPWCGLGIQLERIRVGAIKHGVPTRVPRMTSESEEPVIVENTNDAQSGVTTSEVRRGPTLYVRGGPEQWDGQRRCTSL